ncbi:hypothetical protein E0H89_00545 [Acinetobacter sp. ANC 3781]|uniref:Bbp19 family protein n=1 Tax=Acinetobacter sp. ANC 3781 TaxID=2529835 RepID=UPI00103D9868|nr:hypothetical protein [Acinetobacter sp. ANC 3781]TCB80153.1 hypothetical protein E0H89_00545 [Acinetobacter sp. ANC 3781]
MIFYIALMLIAGLILAVGWWNEVNKNRVLDGKWFDETIVSSKLRNEKHHEWERAEVLQEQVFALKHTIVDLETELSERPLPTPEEEPETGNFVKRKAIRRATPETYRNVFDLDINGQRVLDHLQLTFANKSTYVRGGQDAERESCFKAGQANVIGFIFNQINQANNPDYKEEVND